MSSLLHPTGSEPPQVYWQRRLVVVALAVVVLAGVVWLAWPKGAPTAQPAPTPSASVPSAATTPLVSPSPAVASGSPSGSTTPTGPQTCQPVNLRLGLAGFQKLKQATAQPFKLSITNNSAIPCVLEVNAKNYALTVTSGKDRIWSTADCAAWVPAKNLTLAPQQAYVFDLTWSGARSKATCVTTKNTVGAGTYVAKSTFTGATEARLVMLITAN